MGGFPDSWALSHGWGVGSSRSGSLPPPRALIPVQGLAGGQWDQWGRGRGDEGAQMGEGMEGTTQTPEGGWGGWSPLGEGPQMPGFLPSPLAPDPCVLPCHLCPPLSPVSPCQGLLCLSPPIPSVPHPGSPHSRCPPAHCPLCPPPRSLQSRYHPPTLSPVSPPPQSPVPLRPLCPPHCPLCVPPPESPVLLSTTVPCAPFLLPP